MLRWTRQKGPSGESPVGQSSGAQCLISVLAHVPPRNIHLVDTANQSIRSVCLSVFLSGWLASVLHHLLVKIPAASCFVLFSLSERVFCGVYRLSFCLLMNPRLARAFISSASCDGTLHRQVNGTSNINFCGLTT